jgi:hypothetical protein
VCGASHFRAKWPDALVEQARLLHAQGLNHAQVALACGIPRSTASHWLNGSRRPVPIKTAVSRRWRRNATAAPVEAARLAKKRFLGGLA